MATHFAPQIMLETFLASICILPLGWKPLIRTIFFLLNVAVTFFVSTNETFIILNLNVGNYNGNFKRLIHKLCHRSICLQFWGSLICMKVAAKSPQNNVMIRLSCNPFSFRHQQFRGIIVGRLFPMQIFSRKGPAETPVCRSWNLHFFHLLFFTFFMIMPVFHIDRIFYFTGLHAFQMVSSFFFTTTPTKLVIMKKMNNQLNQSIFQKKTYIQRIIHPFRYKIGISMARVSIGGIWMLFYEFQI